MDLSLFGDTPLKGTFHWGDALPPLFQPGLAVNFQKSRSIYHNSAQTRTRLEPVSPPGAHVLWRAADNGRVQSFNSR